jgi:hypothetical protein
MNEIIIARQAILNDLKVRFKAGDKTVSPNSQWSSPHVEQDVCSNYFSGAGVMPCPVCKSGTLRYSRSGYNGHVHAACSNCECVRWME